MRAHIWAALAALALLAGLSGCSTVGDVNSDVLPTYAAPIAVERPAALADPLASPSAAPTVSPEVVNAAAEELWRVDFQLAKGQVASAPIYPIDKPAVGKILDPPKDQVAWYTGSALPGQPGTSTILGHDATTLAGLSAAQVGDRITITMPSGVKVFEVTRVASIPKDQAVNDPDLSGPQAISGSPQLAVVTCDPEFRKSGHSTHNTVVVAALLPPA